VSEGAQADAAVPRRPQKSEAAFRTISEVSGDLDVPQHVLRFWESRFPIIKPLKRGGGRRYYRPEDVQLLRRIRDLLYQDGYTIRGVQKLLRDQARGGPANADETPEPARPAPPTALPVTPRAAAPAAPASPPATPSMVPAPGITGARRALLETLVSEIDALRAELAAALRKPGK